MTRDVGTRDVRDPDQGPMTKDRGPGTQGVVEDNALMPIFHMMNA